MLEKIEKYFINEKFKVVSEDVGFFFQSYKPLTPANEALVTDQTGMLRKEGRRVKKQQIFAQPDYCLRIHDEDERCRCLSGPRNSAESTSIHAGHIRRAINEAHVDGHNSDTRRIRLRE